MKILRLKIYQPNAVYRIPFSYQRVLTYPIPPFSTVVGLLCNFLGIPPNPNKNESKQLLNELKDIKLSIFGRFSSKVTEYVWYRNLSSKKHKERFVRDDRRELYGLIEHIGGQSPMVLDVLHDVRLAIYIAHPNNDLINVLYNCVKKPQKRIDVLHLGRAEDWIVIEEIRNDVTLSQSVRDGKYPGFFWVPTNLTKSSSIKGTRYKVSFFYAIENGQRNFQTKDCILADGKIINAPSGYFDPELNIPVFFC